MKIAINILISGVMFLTTIAMVNAQPSPSDKGMKMLKECYTAFNYTWATKKGNILIKQLDSIQQKYCTPRLLDKFKNLGADYDILAYNAYTDLQHLKTLTVTKNPEQENAYVVSYIQHTVRESKPVDLKIIIHVILSEDADGFKIASVK